jgi:hypothetical protein
MQVLLTSIINVVLAELLAYMTLSFEFLPQHLLGQSHLSVELGLSSR